MAAPGKSAASEAVSSLSVQDEDSAHQTTFATATNGSCSTDGDTDKSTSAPADMKAKERGIYAEYQHNACLRRVNFASQYHPNVKFLLEALNSLGSEFVISKQVCCERCSTDDNVSGGFDPTKDEVIVCENRSPTQRLTSMLLTHELIHAYDHHKAKVDWTDLKAVACSEIRAANLSGDCSLLSEKFYRWNLGAKHNNKTCVKRQAVSSIVATRDLSREDADKLVDSVWETCFRDHAPFAAVPHKAGDLKFSRFSKYYDPS